MQGRWSLTASLFEGAPPVGPRLRATAELMLERYGIITREMALAEGIPGGFSALYPELSNLEVLGSANRGYFIEGLGGAQFALSGAVERLRSEPDTDGEVTVLATTDPANPWGSLLPWPKLADGLRTARTPGSYVVTRDGEPVLYLEKGGKSLIRLKPSISEIDLVDCLKALATMAAEKRIAPLKVERFDGEPVVGSAFEPVLAEAGFARQPKRMAVPG